MIERKHDDDSDRGTPPPGQLPQGRKPLTAAAQRALAEAAARRAARDAAPAERAKELGGRKGPDPVRYGDWEKDGLASDF
jgi:hypothetical protein